MPSCFSKIPLLVLFSSIVLLFSCATTKVDPYGTAGEAVPHGGQPAGGAGAAQQAEEREITLLFAGDIMAHRPNYAPGRFARIWHDIAPLVSSADLAFANVEAPVAENLPWSTYPEFNMHQSYVEAAIDAGFDVFSLANNHTNDQYLDGITATRSYFASRAGIWACGLREKSGAPLTYCVVEQDGWKILFVAFTEILNRPDYASYIDYYPSTQKKRAELADALTSLAAEHEHDLFVISVHSDEAEYVHPVSGARREWYRRLVDECGADVVWANHPHIVRPWEEITAADGRRALVMYGNGNTISAQRYAPSFNAPETARDETGDGLIIKATFTKKGAEKPAITGTEQHFITTLIAANGQYVIKLLDDDLIRSLDRAELTNWAQYLAARKKILETKTRLPAD